MPMRRYNLAERNASPSDHESDANLAYRHVKYMHTAKDAVATTMKIFLYSKIQYPRNAKRIEL